MYRLGYRKVSCKFCFSFLLHRQIELLCLCHNGTILTIFTICTINIAMLTACTKLMTAMPGIPHRSLYTYSQHMFIASITLCLYCCFHKVMHCPYSRQYSSSFLWNFLHALMKRSMKKKRDSATFMSTESLFLYCQ